MSANFVDEKGDHDIYNKSNVGDGTFKEKEFVTKRNSFNVDKERLASPELEDDDIRVRKRRREHRSEKKR